MYIFLCCVTYNCTVHWADLTYISLLIIFCIIEYVANKTLNPWIGASSTVDFYPTLKAALCHESADPEEDREGLGQGCQTTFLEGQSTAQFRFNPN